MTINKNLILSATVLSCTLWITGCSESVPGADLDRVLDITADSLYEFENNSTAAQDDTAINTFADTLESRFNSANPVVHQGPIGVEAKDDGSLRGYHDKNANSEWESGESDLFTVEIDAEKQRLIATDTNNTVRDHSFSGTGLLAGLLIGNMLSRQRAAGVNSKSLSSKTATSKSAYQSARSRSGSGSHSSGK
jgi:ElaB/YqjD/DUF883 family membrane-anchored ribosome-binding protein